MKFRSPRRLRDLAWRVREASRSRRALIETQLLWRPRRRRRRPHQLNAPLIVSLTSYPPRFASLALTLRCLLSQTQAADMTVLWVGEKDLGELPAEVQSLQGTGLEIRPTRDLGPYTKIIPSLRAYPDAFIVTADDDLYYRPTWLAELTAAYDPRDPAIICHRAHRVMRDEEGRPLSYSSWPRELPDAECSPDLFPTGVGGVLYFPGALPPETLDEDRLMALAPKADDLWLYWMERLARRRISSLGHRHPLVYWPGSQEVALHRTNTGDAGANDLYIARLFAAYGLPLDVEGPAAGCRSALIPGGSAKEA